MRHTRFLSWAQGFYVAGLVLGLLFIIPSPWFPLQIGKVAIAAVFLLIASLLFVLSGGARSLLRDRSPYVVALGALLPLSYLLSYAFSIDRSIGMTGFAIDADTIVFVLFATLAYVLSIGLFRSLWSARVLLLGVTGAALVAMLFQCLVVLFGSSLLPQIFNDRSVNLVGKWNDLGLLVGLIPLLLMVTAEFTVMPMRRKVLSVVAAVVSVVMLAIVNFPLIWALLIVCALILALWSYLSKRTTEASGYMHLVPWVPVAGVLVSGILLLWGAAVNTGLTSMFPVSSLEVRPSTPSSLGIIQDSHGSSVKRFLVGTGPQTFGQDWLAHKPASVNQSPFWTLDFNVGYSSFITALATVGLIGVLAWLVPLVLVLLALVYALRSSHFSQREKLFAGYLAASSIYLWGGVLFYVPSEIVLVLVFALSGATLGFVFSKRQSEETVEHAPSRVMRGMIVVVSVVLVALLALSTNTIVRRYVSESYTNQGLLALQAGNADSAQALAEKAQKVELTGDDLRLSIDAGLAKLQQIGSVGANPTQQQIQDFTAQAQKTIPQGKTAIELNPTDYRVYVSLGRVYDYLNSLGVAGAYDNAKQAYQTAAQYNPTNPQIPLLLARLEAAKGNLPGVTAALQQSLTLKPDYTDAILFVVQLNVAQKDIPNAIRAAAAAVQSAPGVPSIWFELGLLYYTAGDTADAIPPLEQAVKIQNDFANAKYFLGLSYAAQSRTQDAIQQFIDLEKTNPDNQEVKLILTNLQSGKAPFAGAQPPVTNTPQNRTNAPISQ